MKKILKMLKHNAGLKILAFAFAVGLWLYVFNVEDPEITRSYTVEVTFDNTDALSEYDKSYEILNDSDTIRVTVSAQRSIIEELSASDFTATADLESLSEDEMEGQQELEVYVSLNRYSNKTSIVSDTRYVTISIEDELSKSLEVSASTTGTPADGYAVGTINVLPSSVTVSGVESLVEEVSTAVVDVDVSGMDAEQTVSAEVVFYNTSGLPMDMSELTVDYSTVSVYVNCDVVKTIEVLASESGSPADGYRVSGIETSLTEIEVQGDEDALEDLESVTIDGDALDVSGLTEDVTVTVDPADYLPYGVSMYETDITIDVTISIELYENVTLKISTDDIAVENLEDGYSAAFDAESVSVVLGCPADMADSISSSSIELTADLTGRTAGTYYVTLKVQLPDQIYLNTSVGATVVISKD